MRMSISVSECRPGKVHVRAVVLARVSACYCLHEDEYKCFRV